MKLPTPPSRKTTIALILTIIVIIVLIRPKTPETILVAKGGLAYEDWLVPESAAIENQARDIALDNEQIEALLSEDYGFLYAVPLGQGEARHWQSQGCSEGVCAQVTFYDYASGGTVEAIVHLAAERVIAGWTNYDALPGASRHILPRAWAVASTDAAVSAVIPDVRTAEPVMVPMSTWLLEGVCRDRWCVDLTFMAPDESGRVYHVLIDMENEEVADTFYSRGLAARSYSQPQAQQISYNNDCHEQYGWSVCWEMTAHDGINFYDAEFISRPVFSSAKISQVEVFYPDWPGGYRDEIGYGASVPPYFGTNITDLGEGFEVQQLYTEFLRWPNCVCCYRYDQIMRFYADGRFEANFVSHGPGCDDDSIYRPFWRIDMDLGGPENDEVWFWEGEQWQEAETEKDLKLFEDLSPDNQQLFTAGGGLRYYWEPVPTDPFGIDEGRLFLLNFDEAEGAGPIATGPADTFYPPREWVDDEPVSGENFVLWYVPLLNTRWDDPYWCVPQPDPDFSPCEAILRVVPGGELVVQPEIEESENETLPTITPEPTKTASPTATPRPIEGTDAASIILDAGCGACHRLNSIGLEGEIGPDLSNTADWTGNRIDGMNTADYIRQSIVDPDAFIATNCPEDLCRDGIMPDNYADRLTEGQIDAIVDFLVVQGQTVELDNDISLPPPIGQDNVPLGTSSGGTGAQPETAVDSRLLLIPLFVLVVFFGLVMIRVRRNSGDEVNEIGD